MHSKNSKATGSLWMTYMLKGHAVVFANIAVSMPRICIRNNQKAHMLTYDHPASHQHGRCSHHANA
jgi:hypothetical protein